MIGWLRRCIHRPWCRLLDGTPFGGLRALAKETFLCFGFFRTGNWLIDNWVFLVSRGWSTICRSRSRSRRSISSGRNFIVHNIVIVIISKLFLHLLSCFLLPFGHICNKFIIIILHLISKALVFFLFIYIFIFYWRAICIGRRSVRVSWRTIGVCWRTVSWSWRIMVVRVIGFIGISSVTFHEFSKFV